MGSLATAEPPLPVQMSDAAVKTTEHGPRAQLFHAFELGRASFDQKPGKLGKLAPLILHRVRGCVRHSRLPELGTHTLLKEELEHHCARRGGSAARASWRAWRSQHAAELEAVRGLASHIATRGGEAEDAPQSAACN